MTPDLPLTEIEPAEGSMSAMAERFNLPPMVNVPPSEPAPDDLYLMLVAWNSRSEDQRAVALDCADRNRIAAVASHLPNINIAPDDTRNAKERRT